MQPERLGAHVPWARFDSFIEMVLALNLAPEIAIKGPELDVVDPRKLSRCARLLALAKVRPTIHAPFFDLNPGALDPLVRQTTYQRLSGALEVAAQLNAHLMVVHPGFDRWRYPNLDDTWTELACSFFPPLLEQARSCGCRLAIENIYEEAPTTLTNLVDNLDSEWLGHCFDAGHWQLFGKTSLVDWLESISHKLFHLHLHDNHGLNDDHLPVGEGIIDFKPLFHIISNMLTTPSITLEAHSLEHLKRSLHQVQLRLENS